MTTLDLDRIKGLRALAALLREPLASELTRLLDAAIGSPPAVVEQPQAIRYRLVLDDLAARIQAGDPPAALLGRLSNAIGEDTVSNPERAALEAVTEAAAAIREVLAARDPLRGLVWMFDAAEVCARFDVLDQALDLLDATSSTLNVRSEALEQRAIEAVRLLKAGDHRAGRVLLISLAGERAGRALAGAIRHELQQGGEREPSPMRMRRRRPIRTTGTQST